MPPNHEKRKADKALPGNQSIARNVRLAERLAQASLDNAERALDLSGTRYTSRHPEASSLLVTALENILKAHLTLIDDSLIVKGMRQPTSDQIAAGEVPTLGLRDALSQLIAKAGFPHLETHSHELDELRSHRNLFTHFHGHIDDERAFLALSTGFHVYLECMLEWYVDVSPQDLHRVRNLAGAIGNFPRLAQVRKEVLDHRLNEAGRLKTRHFDECTKCLQDAGYVARGQLVCRFCGVRMDLDEAAKMASVDDKTDVCPVCNANTLITWNIRTDGLDRECILCGHFTGNAIRWADANGKSISRLKEELRSDE